MHLDRQWICDATAKTGEADGGQPNAPLLSEIVGGRAP